MKPRFLAFGLCATATLAACGGAPPAPPVVVLPAPAPAAPPPVAIAPPAPPPSEDEGPVPIAATDPTWGSRNAPVTIVMFGDLECPFTAKSSKTVSALEDKYGPTDLRLVWKNYPLPFHPHALAAAEAAEAVHMLGGDAAFWKFAAAALAHREQLAPESFVEWATAAGVVRVSFERLMAADAGAAKVHADAAVGKKLVSGTPAFYVNGVSLSGAQPEARFTALVDAEMEKAKARVASGTSAETIYLAMVKENFKDPPPEAPENKVAEDTTTVWKVPVAGAPGRGGDAPLVTIVEFADFQCPFCKRVESTLERVRTTYGDKVRLVWRDEPLSFHPHALPAAELCREARVEKGVAGFWAVHDALFASQPNLEDSDLAAVAAAAGLDPAKASLAMARDKYKVAIDADAKLAQDLEASGTPHFFINGRRLVGAQPFEKFQTIIDEEIAHAEDLLAKGTKRAALYETLMKGAKGGAPEFETRAVAPAANAPFRGNAGSKVVIEEFADFECPFCKRVEATLTEVMHDKGVSVKLVWRDLPLPMHPHAKLAAAAAREAQRQQGNDGFWKMHDKLLAGQTAPGLERPALDGYAQELGLDLTSFDDALDRGKWDATIAADAKAAADAGISGTPSFVVGGYFISGAQPASRFRAAIAHVVEKGPAKVPLAAH